MIKNTTDRHHEVNQKQTSAGLPGADRVVWYLAILGVVSLGVWGGLWVQWALEIEWIGVRIFIMIQ